MALQRRIRRALHHPATEVVVAALLAVDVQDDPHEAPKVNPPADLVLAADHVLLSRAPLTCSSHVLLVATS